MKYIFRLLTIAVLILVSLFTSCSDNTETPVPKPSIVSFSPGHGLVGATITITGTNFSTTSAENVVKFNGIAATVTNATSTQLTTTVPAGATTGKLTVSVTGNTIQSLTDFMIDLVVELQSIVSFSPTHGLVGTTVVITGTNFSTTSAENVVKFNGIAATVTNATSTQLTTTVPAGASTGKLSLTVSGNTIQSTTHFTVDLPAVVCLLTKFTSVGSEHPDDDLNTTYSTTFEYNDKGELIMFSDDSESSNFTYVDGLVTEVKTVEDDATTIDKWTYNVNKLVNHVESATTYDGGEFASTKDFVYDDAKKLISIKRMSVDATDYLMTFTYTGDNVTAYVAQDIDNDEEMENGTYTDYDTKKNPFKLLAKATGNQAFFLSEVTSAQLLSLNNAITVNMSLDQSNTSVYEYDANNNVTKQTITYAKGGKDIITFEYSCK